MQITKYFGISSGHFTRKWTQFARASEWYMKLQIGSDLWVHFADTFNHPYTHISSLQRKDFKDSSGAKPGTLFPFPELWEPIETEVNYA